MIPVLYEDNHLLVVVKPAGIPVQEDRTGREDLLTVLKGYLKERYKKPGNVYLGLVHRLDQPVGGVMVFAKTSKAASRLSDQIRRLSVEKTYLAVAEGLTKDEAVLEDYLLKDRDTNMSAVVPEGTPGAKQARLTYSLCEYLPGEDLSLIEVRLQTGRSHQIRVQMSAHGHPLWGDARYNSARKSGQSVALFSSKLEFEHPTTHERMCFTAIPEGEPWDRFRTIIKRTE